MKVKIRKQQSGGPFVAVTPLFDRRAQEPSLQPIQTKEPTKIVDDGIDDLLKKGALTSDTNYFYDKINSYENDSFGLLDSTKTASFLNSTKKLANEMINNKWLFEQSVDITKQNGSFQEIAVGNSGEVYYKDKVGNIKTASLSEAKRGGHNLLTISDLLLERQSNNNLAFDQSIFKIASQSVGSENIFKKINDIIAKLGKETTKYDEFLTSDNIASQEERNSLSILKDLLNSPGAYAKVTKESSSERKYLDKALNYIVGTLNNSEKNKLIAIATMNGKDLKSLLVDNLFSQTDEGSTISIDLTKSTKSETNGEGKESLKPKSLFEMQHLGEVNQENIILNNPDTSLKISLPGNRVNLMKDATANTPIEMGPLKNLLDSQTGLLLKQESVYFGDKKIGLSDQQNIIIDPSSGSSRVYVPVNNDGTPNYQLLQAIQEIRKEAPSGATPEELTEYYKSKGLDFVQFDKNFKMISNSIVKPFLMLYGYTDERSNSPENNSQVWELKGSDEDEVEDVLESTYDKLKMGSPTGVFNWSNTFYKGAILIPYKDDHAIEALGLTKNIYSPVTTYEDAAEKQNIQQKGRTISASSSLFD